MFLLYVVDSIYNSLLNFMLLKWSSYFHESLESRDVYIFARFDEDYIEFTLEHVLGLRFFHSFQKIAPLEFGATTVKPNYFLQQKTETILIFCF